MPWRAGTTSTAPPQWKGRSAPCSPKVPRFRRGVGESGARHGRYRALDLRPDLAHAWRKELLSDLGALVTEGRAVTGCACREERSGCCSSCPSLRMRGEGDGIEEGEVVVVGVGDATVAAATGEKLSHRGVRRRGEGGERWF